MTHWEANAFAQENDLQFMETSALTGENVDDAFTSCVRALLAKVKSGEMDSDRLLGSNKQPRGINLAAGATTGPNAASAMSPGSGGPGAASGSCTC